MNTVAKGQKMPGAFWLKLIRATFKTLLGDAKFLAYMLQSSSVDFAKAVDPVEAH